MIALGKELLTIHEELSTHATDTTIAVGVVPHDVLQVSVTHGAIVLASMGRRSQVSVTKHGAIVLASMGRRSSCSCSLHILSLGLVIHINAQQNSSTKIDTDLCKLLDSRNCKMGVGY